MLNPEIKTAIFDAVMANGQGEELAEKIIKWMEYQLQHGTNRSEDKRRASLLFDATTLENSLLD